MGSAAVGVGVAVGVAVGATVAVAVAVALGVGVAVDSRIASGSESLEQPTNSAQAISAARVITANFFIEFIILLHFYIAWKKRIPS